MNKNISQDQRNGIFERLMIGGLTVFAAVAIVELVGSGKLIGPSLLALCCLSISLPFLIFQIACQTLGVTQRHQVLLQTSTVVIALVGVFGLLISISPIAGILFSISCISAYYLFIVFSGDTKLSEGKIQTEERSSNKDIKPAATST